MDLVRRAANFSYMDGEAFVFMDAEDYTQYLLPPELVGLGPPPTKHPLMAVLQPVMSLLLLALSGVIGIAAGDSLFFDADAQHGPEVLVKLPARYLSIISYPQA